MIELSGQQIQTAIAHLDQALYNHEQWYKNLQRALIARLPPDEQDLMPDAHQRCSFGQWYDGDGVDARRELAETVQNRDPLTGARNRESLLSDLREQQALVRRELQESALVMIDLDHFKGINDRNGHGAGDAVLASTAQCIQANVRPYDHLYRYGGEEFLLLMPQVTMDTALETAERLRAKVAAQEIQDPGAGEVLRITASFGVAPLDVERPVEESIDRADKALYQAKAGGRDRVEASV